MLSSIIDNIVDFTEVLRLAGVRASISESIDAILAIGLVDILNKDHVRLALASCLAKSEEERRILQEAFDRFFIAPWDKSTYTNTRIEEFNKERLEVEKEAEELQFQGETIALEDELKEVYANLSEPEKQSIRDFLEKTSTGRNVRKEFGTVVEKVLQSKLRSLQQKSTDGKTDYTPEYLLSEAGIIARDVLESQKNENRLLYKSISQIEDEEMPKVIALIRQISEKLRKKRSARYRYSNKLHRLDFKKTLRKSLAAGGVPFKLSYRHKSARKNKYIILCDVSASMYRFSGFVLQFLKEIHSSFANSNSYIFSDEAEHLNIQSFSNAANFEKQVMQSSVWRKGTNINNALQYILGDRHIVINSSTIVLMISDAKTLDVEKTVENLKQIDKKVKRIIWLNPIPKSDWTRIYGIGGFTGYSKMLDCSTLSKLAASCASFDK